MILLIRKMFILLAIFLFLSSTLYAVYLNYILGQNLPKEPNELTSQTHIMIINHGSVHYASVNELQGYDVANNAVIFSIILFLFAFFINDKYRVFKWLKWRGAKN